MRKSKKMFSRPISFLSIVFLVSLMLVSTVSASDLRVSSLRFIDEFVSPGDHARAFIKLENEGGDIDRLRATVIIPELALRARIGPFAVDDDELLVKKVYMVLPQDTEPGVYTARISLWSTDGEIRRIKHRDIIIT